MNLGRAPAVGDLGDVVVKAGIVASLRRECGERGHVSDKTKPYVCGKCYTPIQADIAKLPAYVQLYG